MMSAPVHLDSTLLASVAYDRSLSLLELQFRDGAVYQYAAVSQDLYEGLIAADSKGAYFNREIRSHMPYTRVKKSK